MNLKKIIVISGPTASGKTKYSIEVARENNGIIINADSMQIYRGLPILSAQPTVVEKKDVEHLLFSHLEPNENCSVGLWLKLIHEKIEYTFSKNKTPIVVGGTGMYISKLIDGISQIPEVSGKIRKDVTELYEKIGYEEFYKKAMEIDEDYVKNLNPNDKQRLMRIMEVYRQTGKTIKYFQDLGNITLYPKNIFFHININPPRDILYERCALRFKRLVEHESVLEEIKNFIKKYPEVLENQDRYSVCNTIGLKEGIQYLNGEITMQNFIDTSVKITRNYAKRQYTWFNHQFDKFDLRIEEIPGKNTEMPIM